MTKIDVYKPTRILSAANASEITLWVRQVMDTNTRHVMLDLSNVMFMDSSGLGSLVAARRIALENGATFALCAVYGQPRMLLDISNVESLFLIFGTRKEYASYLETHCLSTESQEKVSCS
ncbi:STAS domain-containing protein [Vacuolonema iberomarrocanum]|uniref:STAS domain-containing protein n=1 Tax=Vacuolonema iberomarrocanum TaxID=3454632 RepID=UPI0019F44151|nr:STAS domain-containing protein [filamentous cyanobacterium LEGE 07170]